MPVSVVYKIMVTCTFLFPSGTTRKLCYRELKGLCQKETSNPLFPAKFDACVEEYINFRVEK